MVEKKADSAQKSSWLRRHWRPLAGLGTLLLLVYVIGTVTVLPGWVVSLSARPQVDDSSLLKAVTDTRGALLGLLAPLAVLIGGVAALLNYRATTERNREELRLERRRQVTERFTKAIEQLGSEKLDIVLGAIYALEQIANDSDELHLPIIEILSAYLREHARFSAQPADGSALQDEHQPGWWLSRARADVQAIATVIGRRRLSEDPAKPHLDLHEVDLRYVQWDRARLNSAILSGAQLVEALLSKAQLENAYLEGANLRRAHLGGARLHGAHLNKAQLQEARLSGARLEGADLSEAQLQKAFLARANLQRALLRQAEMEGTELGGAQMQGADLSHAQLQGANLAGANLRDAVLRKAKMDGADLSGAQLENADLSDADLSLAIGLTQSQIRLATHVDRAQLPPDIPSDADGSSAAWQASD